MDKSIQESLGSQNINDQEEQIVFYPEQQEVQNKSLDNAMSTIQKFMGNSEEDEL